MRVSPALGLRWRFLKLIALYGLQASLLLVGTQALLAMYFGKPLSLIDFLRNLGYFELGSGALLGYGLYLYFHPNEGPLYVNYAIRRWEQLGLALLASSVTGSTLLMGVWLWTQSSNSWQVLLVSQSGLQPYLGWGVGILLLLLLLLTALGVIWLARSEPVEVFDAQDRWQLKIDSVSHSYGSRTVLKGSWLSCQQGQVVALLGRNGCGKSTLFKILLGQLTPTYKACFINEQPVGHLQEMLGLVAYLPQASCLPVRMRIGQVIDFFAGKHGQWLKEVPRFQPLLQQRVHTLSGGEKRLLELGLVLSLPRAFVLLDEPFSELEPMYKQLAGQWICKAAQRAGVIVTDHDYHQVLAISRSQYLMHQGQTQLLQSPEELKRLYIPT